MMVRFATTCDVITPGAGRCGRRSPEYVAWPSCVDCGDDVCADHQEPGTLIQDEGTNSVTCVYCAADARREPEVDYAHDDD